jgi:lysophospholipase L1-like esterase
MPKRLSKTFLANSLIVLVSLSLSFLAAYYVYRQFMQPSEKKVGSQGADNEYALVFYNQQGKRLTEVDGKLRIITDPFMLYRNAPGQRSKSYFINRYGFRGEFELGVLKRAFVVGGSAAFGQGLQADGETFAHRLDEYIPEYQFINAGIVGVLSGQELSYMVHYLDNFKPALYVVFDGWNDIFGPYMYANAFPSNRVPIGFHFAFFEIENRLESFFEIKMRDQNQKYESGTEKAFPIGMRIENEAMLFEEIAKAYMDNIDKMHAFAQSRNAEFLLVFQPELGNKRNKSEKEKEILINWERAHEYTKRNISERYKLLVKKSKGFCEVNKIRYVDLNAMPEFSDNLNTLFLDVVHPNALGHEIIAKVIHSALQKPNVENGTNAAQHNDVPE